MPVPFESLEAIIFDMDGVLLDTEPLHMQAFVSFLEFYDIHVPPETLWSFIGHSVQENIKVLKSRYAPLADITIEEAARKRDALYLQLLEKSSLTLNSGVADLIDYALNNKLALGVATSSDKSHWQTVARVIKRNEGIDLNMVFEAVSCGDEVPKRKPHPGLYLRACAGLGLEPSKRIIAIEDSPAGIESANSAGLSSIALLTPYVPENQLKAAAMMIREIAEISERLVR
ncbi:MAG TPA: HAD family phosphatase [Caldithrix abyssi]|uniref:HAD family phosphatase n=1 Tax=Caldithrix abyssi TaxID=187145 RepID=A0A7V5VEC8_CALAY|nr:HAD family phosphatase [Caldithrix abyssi]